eukprot:TRINITY_DN4980_c0_g1_i1.p1 TRINITY_DN4980_c0_g1~~TRINITY_DN4980_c0_g1_i1.p1  ORF type:complete len:903 (-),score=310.13 TRINITY_DN4980_c0_g1_i1:130-2838(-)
MSGSEGDDEALESGTPFMSSSSSSSPKRVLPIRPEDCFDIEDFTNASEWESFVSLLEEEIIGGLEGSPEESSPRFLKFSGIEFKFVRYTKDSPAEDFIGFHPVQYFFGLHDFVIVSAQGGEEIDNESKIQWLLSSLSLSRPSIPFLIQCYDKRRLFFEGLSFSKDFRVDYQMLQLRKWPSSLNNLSGILKLFKEKLGGRRPETRVSARASYILTDWLSRSWTADNLERGRSLESLPFGSAKDPLKSLQLNASWKDVPEDLITDNEIHTDLTPEEAPFWSIRIYQEEQPDLLLNSYLQQAFNLTKKVETFGALLGDLINDESPLEHVPNALSRLTGPTYSLTDIIQSGKSKEGLSEQPLSRAELSSYMSLLFPDSLGDKSSSLSSASFYPKEIVSFMELEDEMYEPYKLLNARIKSSPLHGIVWRLSILLNNVFRGSGGLKASAHLLHAFMSEIRARWETGHPIPGLPPGPPDHSYCLFHQKLQMINACILRRRDFEGQIIGDGVQVVELQQDEQEEDEFFDCHDDTPGKELPPWNRKPEGRLKRLGKERLLEYEDYLYIPICQDPAPLTEDQLAEKAALMFHLGLDEEGSNLRAKMQSTSLLSDMEAFKAANPGSILGDFIRWHSPRDWIPEAQDISPRMKNEGNIWLQNWDIAKPVPVKRQKRLFDYTIEADKALNYLSSLNPGEIASLLLPNVFHAGICRLIAEEYRDSVPHVQDLLNEAFQKLAGASRLTCAPEIQHYQSINDFEIQKVFERRSAHLQATCQILSLAELKLSTLYSIKAKFLSRQGDEEGTFMEPFQRFAETLYNSSQNEIDVEGGSMGPIGGLLGSMFEDATRHELMNFDAGSKVSKFPKAYSKEFILRANAPKPHHFSKAGPHKLSCLLKADELKIAGSFSTHLAYS